jgi:hypothetical protein
MSLKWKKLDAVCTGNYSSMTGSSSDFIYFLKKHTKAECSQTTILLSKITWNQDWIKILETQ